MFKRVKYEKIDLEDNNEPSQPTKSMFYNKNIIYILIAFLFTFVALTFMISIMNYSYSAPMVLQSEINFIDRKLTTQVDRIDLLNSSSTKTAKNVGDLQSTINSLANIINTTSLTVDGTGFFKNVDTNSMSSQTGNIKIRSNITIANGYSILHDDPYITYIENGYYRLAPYVRDTNGQIVIKDVGFKLDESGNVHLENITLSKYSTIFFREGNLLVPFDSKVVNITRSFVIDIQQLLTNSFKNVTDTQQMLTTSSADIIEKQLLITDLLANITARHDILSLLLINVRSDHTTLYLSVANLTNTQNFLLTSVATLNATLIDTITQQQTSITNIADLSSLLSNVTSEQTLLKETVTTLSTFKESLELSFSETMSFNHIQANSSIIGGVSMSDGMINATSVTISGSFISDNKITTETLLATSASIGGIIFVNNTMSAVGNIEIVGDSAFIVTRNGIRTTVFDHVQNLIRYYLTNITAPTFSGNSTTIQSDLIFSNGFYISPRTDGFYTYHGVTLLTFQGTNGYFGIGTNIPSTLLDVNGVTTSKGVVNTGDIINTGVITSTNNITTSSYLNSNGLTTNIILNTGSSVLNGVSNTGDLINSGNVFITNGNTIIFTSGSNTKTIDEKIIDLIMLNTVERDGVLSVINITASGNITTLQYLNSLGLSTSSIINSGSSIFNGITNTGIITNNGPIIATSISTTGNITSNSYLNSAGLLTSYILNNGNSVLTGITNTGIITSTGNITTNSYLSSAGLLTSYILNNGNSVLNGITNTGVITSTGNITTNKYLSSAGLLTSYILNNGNSVLTGITNTGIITSTGNITTNSYLSSAGLLTSYLLNNGNSVLTGITNTGVITSTGNITTNSYLSSVGLTTSSITNTGTSVLNGISNTGRLTNSGNVTITNGNTLVFTSNSTSQTIDQKIAAAIPVSKTQYWGGFFTTTSGTFTDCAAVLYPGSSSGSVIKNITLVYDVANSAAGITFQVSDATNGNTMASVSVAPGTTAESKIGLGTIFNVPVNEAIIKMQILKYTGAGAIQFYSVRVDYY